MKTNTIEPMHIILRIMQEKQTTSENLTLIFSNPTFHFVAEEIARLLVQQPENAAIIKELIEYPILQALCDNKSLTDPTTNPLKVLLHTLIKYKKRYGNLLTTEIIMQVIRLEYIQLESVIQLLVPLKFLGIKVDDNLIHLMPKTAMLQSKIINACATLRHAKIQITNELLKHLFQSPIFSETFVLLLLSLQLSEVNLTENRMHEILMREISETNLGTNLYHTICEDEIEKKKNIFSGVILYFTSNQSFPAALIDIVHHYFIDTSKELYELILNRIIVTADHEFDTVKVKFDLDHQSENSSFSLSRSHAMNIKNMREHPLKRAQSCEPFKISLSKSKFFLPTIPSEHIEKPIQADTSNENNALEKNPKRHKRR